MITEIFQVSDISDFHRQFQAHFTEVPHQVVHKYYIWAAAQQNQQNGHVQQRLSSAWASSQSDQSLRCALSG